MVELLQPFLGWLVLYQGLYILDFSLSLSLSISLLSESLDIWLPSVMNIYLTIPVFISLCSGAEYLLEIVNGAIPQLYFELVPTVPAADIAVHILNYLYKKLNEVCHVQGGEVVKLFWPRIICIHALCLFWFM